MISDTELLDMITEDNRLKKDSIDALTKNQFKMYVQFIVDRSRNIVGGEVLSRWEHPLKGLLMPTKYIEIMEHEGTVFELDLYMFEKTCKQLAEWKEKGIDIVLSSNFDRTTIDNPNFMSRIKEIVERYDFDPKNFILEITENSLEKDKKTAYENISFCKSCKLRNRLDDVGSGYTSFRLSGLSRGCYENQSGDYLRSHRPVSCTPAKHYPTCSQSKHSSSLRRSGNGGTYSSF